MSLYISRPRNNVTALLTDEPGSDPELQWLLTFLIAFSILVLKPSVCQTLSIYPLLRLISVFGSHWWW